MKYFRTNLNCIPKVIMLNTEHLIPPRGHRNRVSTEYIMYYIIKGTLYMTVNGEKFELNEGEAGFFDIGEHHSYYELSDCEYYYVHFVGDASFPELDENEVDRFIFDSNKRTLTGGLYAVTSHEDGDVIIPVRLKISSASMHKRIRQLLEEGRLWNGTKREPCFKTGIGMCFNEIILLLFREYIRSTNDRQRFSDKYISGVADYLQNNHSSSITGDDIGKAFGFSFDYINKRFREATGKTVFRYLTDIRIENAVHMLLMTDKSISEIADECGFCDVYYFSRVFKEKMGMSPTKYLRQYRTIRG